MNIDKLREAEIRFLKMHPLGFEDPEIIEIGKKYRMKLRIDFCRENFAKAKFKKPHEILENLGIIVRRSALVSMFEKAKFKDVINVLSEDEVICLSNGLKDFIHGNQEFGFEQIVEILSFYKIAKWPIITLVPMYYKSDYEIFVKPTTVKNIIKFLEIDDLKYSPNPSFDFYSRLRKYINEMKTEVDSSLSPSNVAFTGFLMMSM